MTIAIDLDCGRHACGNCEYAREHSAYSPQDGAECGIFGKELPREKDAHGSFRGYGRLAECADAGTDGRRSVTVSRPAEGAGANGGEYLLDGQGRLLEFPTVNDALEYLAERNCTLDDILGLRINCEAAAEEALWRQSTN